jgi:glutamine amidotransferase/cyclase
MPEKLKVSLLDYGAGNVRSVRNAIAANGYEIQDITTPEQIVAADCIVFPGVGSFGSAMRVLKEKGFYQPLRDYLADYKRPYLGICLGMQTLFESSDEHEPGADPIPGLGVIPGKVIKFNETHMAVPHIGWNGRILHQDSAVLKHVSPDEDAYFVHSFYAPLTAENAPWVLTTTTYSGQAFVSAIQRGSVVATQFHPEKSGVTGLHVLKGFLEVSDCCWSAGRQVALGYGRLKEISLTAVVLLLSLTLSY